MNARETVKAFVDALASKKGRDLLVLDLRGLTVIADYFIMATGSSPLNIRALADAVEHAGKAAGMRPLRVEGLQDASWVLMDFGDVVLHIFDEEHREFYQLERLWSDAPRVPIDVEG